MSNEKISSLELISALSEQTGITKKNATAFMRQFAETIEGALLRDGVVKIKGFGTFKIIWNESRSSVNVQTGERYEIAGHNKITFTPDEELKEIVNEPYAHLDPVDLDGNVIEKHEEQPEEDPHMKRFSEQANEIMNMIAEMQALRPKKNAKATSEPIKPKNSDTSFTPVESPAKSEPANGKEPIPVANDDIVSGQAFKATPLPAVEKTKETFAVEEAAPQTQPVEIKEPGDTEKSCQDEQENETTTPNTEEDSLVHRMARQPAKKSYKWLYISLILLVLLGAAALLGYIYYPVLFPTAGTKKVEAKPIAVKPTPTMPQAVAVADTSQQKPVAQAEPKPAQKETVKDVFSEPRIYKEFIATETAIEGTSLTLLSLKHYGHKLFWVYIYEANKEHIKNPGILPPGTKIKIPKLDPRLIDKYNGQCFRQASALQTKYTENQ